MSARARPIALWLWLAAGATIWLHGVITGGGPAGWVLYRALLATGRVSPSLIHGTAAVVLCLPPAALLLWRARRRAELPPHRPPPAGGLRRAARLLAVAALTFGSLAFVLWRVFGFAERTAPTPSHSTLVAVGDLRPGQAAPEGPVRFVGTAEPASALSYREETYGKTRTYGHSHGLLPLAAEGASAGATRVLVDLADGADLPTHAGPFETPPVERGGYLPAYVLWALRAKGLAIDDAVPLFVLVDGSRLSLRNDVLIFVTALTAVASLAGFVAGLAARLAASR